VDDQGYSPEIELAVQAPEGIQVSLERRGPLVR
jgi:hypothetical protein